MACTRLGSTRSKPTLSIIAFFSWLFDVAPKAAVRLARLEGRMDGLENQMKVVIELLTGKKIT